MRSLLRSAGARVIGASVILSSCSTSPTDPYEPPILQETFSDSINAMTSAPCPTSFVRSVHPDYYRQGTGRCVEFRQTSATAGTVRATLTWPDRRLDLDLVLNDGVGTNFALGIGGNKGSERIEAFVNANTTYVFIVHLQGIDTFFLAGGGVFSGDVATPFSIAVERPR